MTKSNSNIICVIIDIIQLTILASNSCVHIPEKSISSSKDMTIGTRHNLDRKAYYNHTLTETTPNFAQYKHNMHLYKHIN